MARRTVSAPTPKEWLAIAKYAIPVVLVANALWVALTHEWPEVAALWLLLAVVYDYRTTETLRRVRLQLADPTP